MIVARTMPKLSLVALRKLSRSWIGSTSFGMCQRCERSSLPTAAPRCASPMLSNCCQQRKQKSRVVHFPHQPAFQQRTPPHIENAPQARQASRDDRFRQMTALRAYGLTQVEIAKRMGLSERAVRTWLKRATAPTWKRQFRRRSVARPLRSVCAQAVRHKTITDWAWQMILYVSRWLPTRRLVSVADGTYAVLDFLLKVSHLPRLCVITRLRLDACLYDPAPAREEGKKGRPALKGQRQPKPAERLRDPHTVWRKHLLSWYGGSTREMEMATGTALWYHSPVPPTRSAGCSFATPRVKTSLWPCFAPINRPRRPQWSSSWSCAGPE